MKKIILLVLVLMTLTACGNDEATATEINDLQAKVRVLQKEVGALTIQVNELKSGGGTTNISSELKQQQKYIRELQECMRYGDNQTCPGGIR
tara:strand:+ start:418 stop:693 length:276 start_codon:yes stop_codon:yes gene_type:complete